MIKHKRAIFVSGLVLLGEVIQGLFLHPYQTMQNLVKEKVFIWLSFTPLVFIILSFLISRFVGLLLTSCKLFNLADWQLVKQTTLFLFDWWLIFLSYWQALLTYLLLRFVWAFWSD